MTSFRQPNAAAVSSEVKDAGVAATMGEAHFIDAGGGVFSLEKVSAGNPTGAECVDWHHDRSAYELTVIETPYVMIDDGAGNIILATSGTPIAILVDDGGGALKVSTDLTQTPAGAFYPGANGDLIPVRFDDRRLRFSEVGDTFFSFESA